MIRKILWFLYCAAGVLFVAWVLFSWLDIIADNIAPNPVHWQYNFFVLFVDIMEALKQ